jgi:hypothetical protein
LKKHLIIDRDVLERLPTLVPQRRLGFWMAVAELVESFGRPHIHSGLGIRKLRHKLFECRIGIDLRLLFQDRENDLYLTFLGSHDEVLKEVKSGKHD